VEKVKRYHHWFVEAEVEVTPKNGQHRYTQVEQVEVGTKEKNMSAILETVCKGIKVQSDFHKQVLFLRAVQYRGEILVALPEL